MLNKEQLIAKEQERKQDADKRQTISLVESFVALGLDREQAIVAAGAERIIADMKEAGVDPATGSQLVKEVLAHESPDSETWASLIDSMGGN
jgi:hypothetical protein